MALSWLSMADSIGRRKDRLNLPSNAVLRTEARNTARTRGSRAIPLVRD